MAFKRSWVRLPYPPPAFATSTARREGCHAVGLAEAGELCGLGQIARRLRLGVPAHGGAKRGDMNHYVYILTSKADPTRHYTGCTTNLADRLQKHNEGGVPHTRKHRPWNVETVIRFTSKEKARAFEAHLKTGSGREFARRHF